MVPAVGCLHVLTHRPCEFNACTWHQSVDRSVRCDSLTVLAPADPRSDCLRSKSVADLSAQATACSLCHRISLVGVSRLRLCGLTYELRRERRDGAWPAGRMMGRSGKRTKCHPGASRLQRRLGNSPRPTGQCDCASQKRELERCKGSHRSRSDRKLSCLSSCPSWPAPAGKSHRRRKLQRAPDQIPPSLMAYRRRNRKGLQQAQVQR